MPLIAYLEEPIMKMSKSILSDLFSCVTNVALLMGLLSQVVGVFADPSLARFVYLRISDYYIEPITDITPKA